MSIAWKAGDPESCGVVSTAERHLAIETRFVKGLLADLPLDAVASRLRVETRIRGLEAEQVVLTGNTGRKVPAH